MFKGPQGRNGSTAIVCFLGYILVVYYDLRVDCDVKGAYCEHYTPSKK